MPSVFVERTTEETTYRLVTTSLDDDVTVDKDEVRKSVTDTVLTATKDKSLDRLVKPTLAGGISQKESFVRLVIISPDEETTTVTASTGTTVSCTTNAVPEEQANVRKEQP